MTIFADSINRLFLFACSFKRMGCLTLCVSSAMLAGCAGTDGQKSIASTDSTGNGLYSADYNWSSSSDPIGALLSRNKNGKGIVPSNIKHPIAALAMTQIGTRYRYGGKSPDTGFDCSGLVGYSASQSLGLKLPPRSDEMAKFGDNVPRSDLQVGDLVFFNTMGRRFSHVGVYIGQDQFVHSPAAGGRVRVENINERYWNKRFTGARRLDLTEVASTR